VKALVIAAGKGTRLNGQTRKNHKALIEVCGVTVVERIMDACPQVDELVVVTGYLAEQLECELRRLLAGKVRLSFVRNLEWDRGNGLSVLSAKELLSGEKNFLLMMSDHLVEPDLIRRLCMAPPKPGECLLAVDRDIEGVFDLEDATKVLLGDQGRIETIGKGLEKYDALDTGVFFCTPALFDALEEAASGGGESLSDGIQVLCRRRAMGYRDVTGCLWQDIDSPECVTEAEKRLWHTVPKPRDGVVSRLLNRKISGLITRAICRLPVEPNHVTVFNLLLAGLAAWLMATGQLLAGAVVAQAYSIIDGVDGELARLKNRGSWFGGWFDNICDRLCDWLIIIGAACAARYLNMGDTFFWILLCSALVSNLAYWTAMDSLLLSGVLREPAGKQGPLGRIEAWFYERGMVFGLTHDTYILILAVGVAAGFPAYTLLLLIALETLWWIAKIFQVRYAKPNTVYVDYLAKRNI
jgi:1L-myo-inositol 1-phosphate cytidylyltransferase / CDP-L-myo-inositol myo-inositolphosphotransferase